MPNVLTSDGLKKKVKNNTAFDQIVKKKKHKTMF